MINCILCMYWLNEQYILLVLTGGKPQLLRMKVTCMALLQCGACKGCELTLGTQNLEVGGA